MAEPANSIYSFRCAEELDAETIARHRACMFREMGSISDAEANLLFLASVPWLKGLLAAGRYKGWLAMFGQDVVGGGGIHLLDLPPMPDCCQGGRGGHIVNIYTLPAHRRRGIARSLMNHILAWADAQHLNRLTLTSSMEGRPLYKSLGFIPTAEMQLPMAPGFQAGISSPVLKPSPQT
jgi:GNAT superfamily N-acetyltransferase